MTLRKQVQDRLIQNASSYFNEIKGAASLSEIIHGRVHPDGCYIFKEKSISSENSLINAVNQRVVDRLSIVIVTRNTTDQKGSDSSDNSELLQNAVMNEILGFEPTGGYEPIEYAGGSLVSLTNGFYIWLDTYKSAHFVRSL